MAAMPERRLSLAEGVEAGGGMEPPPTALRRRSLRPPPPQPQRKLSMLHSIGESDGRSARSDPSSGDPSFTLPSPPNDGGGSSSERSPLGDRRQSVDDGHAGRWQGSSGRRVSVGHENAGLAGGRRVSLSSLGAADERRQSVTGLEGTGSRRMSAVAGAPPGFNPGSRRDSFSAYMEDRADRRESIAGFGDLGRISESPCSSIQTSRAPSVLPSVAVSAAGSTCHSRRMSHCGFQPQAGPSYGCLDAAFAGRFGEPGSRRMSFSRGMSISAAGGSCSRRESTAASRRGSLSFDAMSGLAALHRVQEERRWAAACTIQRCVRGKKSRANIDMWMGAVRKLRDSFIDERAVRAGVASNPMYSDANLAARDALRENETVLEALEDAWVACRNASGRPDATGLNQEEYFIMSRKIYLATKSMDGDADVSVDDVQEAAEEDWLEDSQGADELSEEALKNCWFQLADVHTESIEAVDYARWIRTVVAEMIVDRADQREFDDDDKLPVDEIDCWRADSDMLEAIRIGAGLGVKSFRSRSQRWYLEYEPSALQPSPKPKARRVSGERLPGDGTPKVPARRSSVGARQSSIAEEPPKPRHSITEQTGSGQGSIKSQHDEPQARPASAAAGSESAALPGRPPSADAAATIDAPATAPMPSRGSKAPSGPGSGRPSRPGSASLDAELADDDGGASFNASRRSTLQVEPLIPGRERENSFSRRLTVSSADDFTPGQLLRQAGAVATPPGGSRPDSSGPSPRNRRSIDSPGALVDAVLTVGAWKRHLGEVHETGSPGSSPSNSASPSFQRSGLGLDLAGAPKADPADWLRPITPREARPWSRLAAEGRPATTPGRPWSFAEQARATHGRPQRWTDAEPVRLTTELSPRTNFGSQLLEVRMACNRLVREVSAHCTKISRDTDWPVVEVDVWFGSHEVPLSMAVLYGSAAMRMSASELAARLTGCVKAGLPYAERMAVYSKLVYPIMPKERAAAHSPRPGPSLSPSFRQSVMSGI